MMGKQITRAVCFGFAAQRVSDCAIDSECKQHKRSEHLRCNTYKNQTLLSSLVRQMENRGFNHRQSQQSLLLIPKV